MKAKNVRLYDAKHNRIHIKNIIHKNKKLVRIDYTSYVKLYRLHSKQIGKNNIESVFDNQ